MVPVKVGCIVNVMELLAPANMSAEEGEDAAGGGGGAAPPMRVNQAWGSLR